MYLTEDLLDAISSIDKVRELIETVKVSFVVIFFSSDPWPVPDSDRERLWMVSYLSCEMIPT